MACPGKYNPWNVLRIAYKYYFGEWLFLYYIAKNLDNYVFKALFENLAKDLENKHYVRYKILPLDVEQELLKKQREDKPPMNENEYTVAPK